ncbi:hypothetical protein CAC42_5999 [Sphaceloma murrayae]|uniref:Uncharacterized protein n=1 Tax=Sphaceloma murrayae TaxID=2082308 RepID=A0A2K1QZT4_9PEZI|nr:hypothetical protein CAC42_5999 [Sphaceloma murrayae]
MYSMLSAVRSGDALPKFTLRDDIRFISDGEAESVESGGQSHLHSAPDSIVKATDPPDYDGDDEVAHAEKYGIRSLIRVTSHEHGHQVLRELYENSEPARRKRAAMVKAAEASKALGNVASDSHNTEARCTGIEDLRLASTAPISPTGPERPEMSPADQEGGSRHVNSPRKVDKAAQKPSRSRRGGRKVANAGLPSSRSRSDIVPEPIMQTTNDVGRRRAAPGKSRSLDAGAETERNRTNEGIRVYNLRPRKAKASAPPEVPMNSKTSQSRKSRSSVKMRESTKIPKARQSRNNRK